MRIELVPARRKLLTLGLGHDSSSDAKLDAWLGKVEQCTEVYLNTSRE